MTQIFFISTRIFNGFSKTIKIKSFDLCHLMRNEEAFRRFPLGQRQLQDLYRLLAVKYESQLTLNDRKTEEGRKIPKGREQNM
jgi:hypothetical protein